MTGGQTGFPISGTVDEMRSSCRNIESPSEVACDMDPASDRECCGIPKSCLLGKYRFSFASRRLAVGEVVCNKLLGPPT